MLPDTTAAYFTTAQSATRVSSDTVLYTVSYSFGFADRGLYMPIMATATDNAEQPASKELRAAYTFRNSNDESILPGVSNALILTGSRAAEVVDGTYYLEPGESATFTLVALLTVPLSEQAVLDETSLLVTHLPFTMVIDDTPYQNRLNPTELQYYRTPGVEW